MRTLDRLKDTTPRDAILGIFAIAIFVYTAVVFSNRHEIPELFWVCHISSLVLGISLLLGHKGRWAWSALIWLSLGTPLWIMDSYSANLSLSFCGFLNHAGSLLIACIALYQTSKTHRGWTTSMAILVLLQLVSKMFLPPDFNINLSHSVYPMVSSLFPSYPWFWLAGFAFFLIATQLIERGFEFLLKIKVCAEKQPAANLSQSYRG